MRCGSSGWSWSGDVTVCHSNSQTSDVSSWRWEVAAMDLFEVMSTCRALRRLRPDPVPDAVVRRLVEAANYAPSGREPPARTLDRRSRPRAAAPHRRPESAGEPRPRHRRAGRRSRVAAPRPRAPAAHVGRRALASGAHARGTGHHRRVLHHGRSGAGSRPVCQLDLAGRPEPVAGRPGVRARGRADDLCAGASRRARVGARAAGARPRPGGHPGRVPAADGSGRYGGSPSTRS